MISATFSVAFINETADFEFLNDEDLAPSGPADLLGLDELLPDGERPSIPTRSPTPSGR